MEKSQWYLLGQLTGCTIKFAKELEKYSNLTWVSIVSGSVYSGTTCHGEPDEDHLLCPTEVKCRIEESTEHPCYCRVFIKDRKQLPRTFQDILTSRDELTSSSFRDYCFKLLERYFSCERRRHNKKSSPTYTMEFSDDGTVDMVPCLKLDQERAAGFSCETPLTEEEKRDCHVYVVPKSTSDDDDTFWRISFSSFEGEIILKHFSKCRKDFLVELKLELKGVKCANWKLSGYHLLTFMLHDFKSKKYPKSIQPREKVECVNLLIDALKAKCLKHFFIPELNLLKDVNETECQKFIETLKNYKKTLA